MVNFVFFLQAAQNGYGFLNGRLFDENRLEPSFQRRILFDVFLVFIERRGADGSKFSSGQGRFQHVRGVYGTLRGAGTDESVHLVDEQDDVAFGRGDFLDDRLQAVLEFSPVFGSGEHAADVQGDDPLIFQKFGNVFLNDSQGQPFHDGGFSDARLPRSEPDCSWFDGPGPA